ncbi:NIN-like protein [Artemisia annua]|uniref:NIN-like protein n=1 Tax=Artemisia annua TaxID=35608 RepID=A0A2U1NRB4_ARTAN|nr:NIN-like protein [Artemisia annua]
MAYWEDPSGFLVSFPTYRLHNKPEPFSDGVWVFSSKDERYENNSYSLDDVGTRMMIYDKIKSVLSKIEYRLGTIIQFWAPVTIGGKHLLSTSGQPFAVSSLDSSLENYRRRCVEHVYDVDVNSKFGRGTPASAFLNRFPEITDIHEVDPLLRNAFQECGLNNCFMIPICCPSQTSSSSDCIGVIECSSWYYAPLDLFKEMKMMNMKIKVDQFTEAVTAYIQEVGLSVYSIQDRIPYKTINGLKLATDQIQEALKVVCQSHQIALAQVWIASLDENHVHFSSSWEEAQTRRQLALKLTGYNSLDEDSTRCWSFQNYYDNCDLIPLQPGEELVLKTLQDYEPRFCKNISELGTNKLMGWVGDEESRCLTICMRSFHTGDFNYVFEFIWEHDSLYPISLEEILLNIKKCLPSFKFASGTEIGEKLRVIEVENSTDKEIKKFDIFQSERLSPIPEALKEGKKQVGVDYIAPLGTKCKPAPVLTPQQVIEQQFGISTTENFLAAENIFGNENLMADRDDERLSEFLKTLPSYILHKEPETEGALWVFCSGDEDDLGTRMICDKIKSAFSKVKNNGELIVQFWAPIGNRRVLSPSGQPFAVSDFGEGLKEYRGRCMGYECNIDMNNHNKDIKDEIEPHGDGHPLTMISGPPTNAFLNRLPEAVLDTENHRESSLMRYAADCGLWTSYTLPIGCPSQYHSSCIGVVECSSMSSINLEIVNTMKRALEHEGLNVFNVQDRIPYNTINGLTLVRDEIQVALKSVCESCALFSHKIGVAQVWISCEDENHAPFSFSSEDTQTTRRLALKLTGYNSVDEDSTACHWRFKEYCDACDMVPLKMGEELVEKTLQDNQPRFCENISQLGTDTLMAWVSTDDVACSGFTICMSIDTGDFSCAFEFIWHHNSDYVLLLEALLLTLKRHLPRFNFASGAELGDQLDVIDVENSTKSETRFFKIFKEKRLSPIPEAIDKGKKEMVVYNNARSKRKRDTTKIRLSRDDVKQHYGKTMNKAAKELRVAENIFGDGNPMADRDDERCSGFDTTPKEKRLSPVPEAMNKGKKAMVVNYNARSKKKHNTKKVELSREEIEQHYGKMSQKEAAIKLRVSVSTLKRKCNELGMPGWQGPDLPKREAYNSNKNQSKESHTHEKDNGVIQDPSPVKRNENTVIKAQYADDKIILHLPISEATFVTVENEIGKRFKLEDGTFKIKFLDKDEEWILMNSDQDWSYCIQNSRNVDRSAVQLLVLLHNK